VTTREAYLRHMRTAAGMLRDLEHAIGAPVPMLAELHDATCELQAHADSFGDALIGGARRAKAFATLARALELLDQVRTALTTPAPWEEQSPGDAVRGMLAAELRAFVQAERSAAA
jgi:hypothetical protein